MCIKFSDQPLERWIIIIPLLKKCKVWLILESQGIQKTRCVSDIQTHCACLYSIVVREEWMSHVVEGLYSKQGQKYAFSACNE